MRFAKFDGFIYVNIIKLFRFKGLIDRYKVSIWQTSNSVHTEGNSRFFNKLFIKLNRLAGIWKSTNTVLFKKEITKSSIL